MKDPEYRAISFMCELPMARDGFIRQALQSGVALAEHAAGLPASSPTPTEPRSAVAA